MSIYQQAEQLFSQHFQSFELLVEQVLKPALSPDDWSSDYSNAQQDIPLSADAERIGILKVTKRGSVDIIGSKRLLLFEVVVHDDCLLARSRVGIQRIVRQWVVEDCALIVFRYSHPQGRQWRLSYVEMGSQKSQSTSARRYTYLLGPGQGCRTAAERFAALAQKASNGIMAADLTQAFSVESLTKEFYNDLYHWYLWAVDPATGVTFPSDTSTDSDDREDIETKIIRLITRLMFVWFIKQKDLVPDYLFNIDQLQNTLCNFEPHSNTSGQYYQAILQNLFFATLNRAITDEKGRGRAFAEADGKDIKTLYRYSELFQLPKDEVVKLFASVPFLNGGLFECLDKTQQLDGVARAFNYDGFSRNSSCFPGSNTPKYRAVVPNALFFGSSCGNHEGLISILSRYNFTIEENTPSEQQVALDPELLGRVFENLLGVYNPETKETARNQSGSFYTPREVVNYMVDECLRAYLGNEPEVDALIAGCDDLSRFSAEKLTNLSSKLLRIKIFDPACGSGAFPMGLLNRMVDILLRINPDTDVYSLKLNIIENCIYGSDIQCIAAQITKLRFFISLVCDCQKHGDASNNFGIPTLPNLETKFVAANTLIGLHRLEARQTASLFDVNIDDVKAQLHTIRSKHFKATTAQQKIYLRQRDQELRKQLSDKLEADHFLASADSLQLTQWNPYDQNAVAPFFDPEWMFGIADGFDVVIGNPPYIQLQNNGGALASLYADQNFSTFARTGDIYCLFYERGLQLLSSAGHLCYITSNKWMRAGYGEQTRAFLAQKNPKLLIDFAGTKVFDNATVDTNILLVENAPNQQQTLCCSTKKLTRSDLSELDVFVQTEHSMAAFNSAQNWVVLSPIEQSIKQKIEAVGTPLKEWDIQINYGIKTGYNEAFIVSTEKRNEILANCTTAEERERTAALIRPILRGRDIKRYGYEWAELWLIATFPALHYDIEEYPAVKKHLLSFGKERLEQTGKTYTINGETIKARKKTSNKWFEVQDSIAYWNDFLQPKICWKAVGRNLSFAIVEAGTFLTAPASFISAGIYNEFILAFLCSTVGKYYIYQNSDTTGAGDIMLNIQSLIKFPIPKDLFIEEISSLCRKVIDNQSENYQKKINELIYNAYKFSTDEIREIEKY